MHRLSKAVFLSVSKLVMDLVVTRTAQRHQVSADMGSALGYRQHMMYLVHRG